MAGARRLLIGSMANMREMGGFATQDERTTRYRCFIRSDAPLRLFSAEIEYLLYYGVNMAIDLRQTSEAKESPSSLSRVPGVTYYNIPFSNDANLMRGGFHPYTHYAAMLQSDNRIRDIFGALAASQGVVVFHCSLGKDRTGIIAALLLMLARVPWVDIIADYQVSYTYIRDLIEREIAKQGRTYSNAKMDAFRSEGEWLEPFFRFLDGCGGVESYLTGIGVAGREMRIIREKFVTGFNR